MRRLFCCAPFSVAFLFLFGHPFVPGAGSFVCRQSTFWFCDNTPGPVPAFSVSVWASIVRGKFWPWRVVVINCGGNTLAVAVFVSRHGPWCWTNTGEHLFVFPLHQSEVYPRGVPMGGYLPIPRLTSFICIDVNVYCSCMPSIVRVTME